MTLLESSCRPQLHNVGGVLGSFWGLAIRQVDDVQARSRHFGHQDLIWGSVTVVLDHHALNATRLRQRDGENGLGIMTAVILISV